MPSKTLNRDSSRQFLDKFKNQTQIKKEISQEYEKLFEQPNDLKQSAAKAQASTSSEDDLDERTHQLHSMYRLAGKSRDLSES